MERDNHNLDELIRHLKRQETDLKQAFLYIQEQEQKDIGTNIMYNGSEGIMMQNDLSVSTWSLGSESGSISNHITIRLDAWGDENKLRMMFPVAEWVKMDRVIKSAGITIQPAFMPWNLIGLGFTLSFMNGYHLIYPWGNFVQLRVATKPLVTQESLEKTEHEMTVSVMLRKFTRRRTEDCATLCIYPEERLFAMNTINLSGNYLHSSIGRRFSRWWNEYCEHAQKQKLLSDGVVFKNRDGHFYSAGGENFEDIAVVYEKGKKIITPGIHDGTLPGSTMVVFCLIGEASGYKVQTRAITMEDIQRADWGIVTENATFLRWDAVIDTEKHELIRVTKRNRHRFENIFLRNFIRLKHGEDKTLGLPKLVETGEEWFPETKERRELALQGLRMKKQRWNLDNMRDVRLSIPGGELLLKRRRAQIANLFGKYWDLAIPYSYRRLSKKSYLNERRKSIL